MKTYLGPAAVVLLLLLLPVSAGPSIQGIVDLPGEVEGKITAFFVFAISWLFVQLITLVPVLSFLDEFKIPLAMAVSAQVIAWIERIVPDAYGGIAIAGIVFLLSILALFMTARELMRRNAPGFRARS